MKWFACPGCSALIPRRGDRCPHCHAELAAAIRRHVLEDRDAAVVSRTGLRVVLASLAGMAIRTLVATVVGRLVVADGRVFSLAGGFLGGTIGLLLAARYLPRDKTDS